MSLPVPDVCNFCNFSNFATYHISSESCDSGLSNGGLRMFSAFVVELLQARQQKSRKHVNTFFAHCNYHVSITVHATAKYTHILSSSPCILKTINTCLAQCHNLIVSMPELSSLSLSRLYESRVLAIKLNHRGAKAQH